MSLILILLLALVQGLTEFLPVSSSAHLILAGDALGAGQDLAFDVAAHLGTLVAVVVYFRRELAGFAAAALRGGAPRERRLAGLIALATLPAAAAGFAFHDQIAVELRSARLIAATTVGFGVLLWVSDRFRSESRDEYALAWRGALGVGMAQALALVPGVSRSGITMTAALFLGLSRQAAARFSFLLAIPVLALAGAYEAWQVAGQETAIRWREFWLAALFAGISGYAVIGLFLRWIERVGMTPFVLYRLVLGCVLFVLYW